MVRPKQFDREQALRSAMHLFWTKGYEATSIPDLLRHMGLSRSSLYETYGDKRALFIEAFDHYRHVGERKRDLLRNAESAREGIRSYFEMHIDFSLDERLPGGCLVTNTAVSLDADADPDIRRMVEERFAGLEEEFYRLLEKGRRSGELDGRTNSRELARLFNGLSHGISVVARVNRDRRVLEDMVNAALALL